MTDNPALSPHSRPASPGFEGINTATARGVRRHSQFIGVLRWALPFFCLLIIGVFLFSSGIVQNILAPESVEVQPVIAENTVEMIQPRMSGLDKKDRAYELSAQTATQSTDDPTKVTLENITGSLMLNESDGKVTMSAKSGFMDSETNFLQLRKDIIITSKKGYTAYLTSADAKLKQKYVISNDPVLIVWDDGSIKANGLEVSDSGNVIRFFNRVKVNLKPAPGKKDLN